MNSRSYFYFSLIYIHNCLLSASDWVQFEMLVHLLASVSLGCESGSFRFLEYQESSIVLLSSISNQIDTYVKQLIKLHNEEQLFYLEILIRQKIIYLEHRVIKIAEGSASKYAKIEQMAPMLAQKRHSDLEDNQTVVVTTFNVEVPKEVVMSKVELLQDISPEVETNLQTIVV